ncbi:uncharacterized protein LOC130976221 [Arachis stenosperma]|uniref:uncharacterized protein LOC130976221 n=1 Tax=Arachis stenosperma TaxID=217475 RepID=UPI0025AC5745|nr:uncharacterized protein LOC130976221 [Arachis stenosperma]
MLPAPYHRVSSSLPCCFAVHGESLSLLIRHEPPSQVNNEERERAARRRIAPPSRSRRPRRAAVEPTEQKSIAAVRASIAVREASMAVAVELTSERRELQVRGKGVAPPFFTAQQPPCRRVPPPLLTAACHRRCSPPRRSLAYAAAFRARFTGSREARHRHLQTPLPSPRRRGRGRNATRALPPRQFFFTVLLRRPWGVAVTADPPRAAITSQQRRERERAARRRIAPPSRSRRPRRAAVEPTEQKPIAAVRASIAVREASMAVAVELTSERRELQVRGKGVAPPFFTAQQPPCRRVPPPLLTAACHRRCSPPRATTAAHRRGEALPTLLPSGPDLPVTLFLAFLNPIPLLFYSTVLIFVSVSGSLLP